MKKSGLFWVFIIGAVVAVLYAFNYQGTNQSVPLSEIFPGDEGNPVDFEYEFIEVSDSGKEVTTNVQAQVTEAKTEVKQQVAQVTESVEQKTTEVTQAITQVADLTKIPYTIQIASFKEKAMAEKALIDVQQKDHPGYIVSKDLGSKGTWHRIYVGQFQNKDEADQYLSKVQSDFKNSFVIAPK